MEWILKLLSRIPLRVHYWFADWVIFPITFYIVRYRRALVEQNLQRSFPSFSKADLHILEKKFYHHLADVIVEIIYGYSISPDEMKRRVTFRNAEQTLALVEQYGGVIVMLAHLGNWEWLADFQQHLTPYGIFQANLYRQLNSSIIDNAMRSIRQKRGGILIDKRQILRQMLNLRKEGKKVIYGFICDQKPRPNVARLWTEFLHQETGFLDGSEVLAKKFKYPVFYLHITCPKRGFYETNLVLLSEHPQFTSDNEITLHFAQKLEQNILQQPEIWLWSHNRWKWGRPNTESDNIQAHSSSLLVNTNMFAQ